jgi:CheY-like chemotaxis protein
VIKSSGEALLALLNDLLDFSKIEAGKVELEIIAMTPMEILESACLTFEPMAREKGVALKVDLSAASGRYMGDPTRIRQITQNLVSNGLKFTEHGEVRVTAQVLDGRLFVEVRDTGIGMNARSLDRLFGEFAQGDATTTRRFGGTGLGLTISRSLARLMGGDVTVQSQLGRGSTFRLNIPLAQSVGRLKVLVAEDNASNRLVLQNLLVHTGADCTYVENGLKALEAWKPGSLGAGTVGPDPDGYPDAGHGRHGVHPPNSRPGDGAGGAPDRHLRLYRRRHEPSGRRTHGRRCGWTDLQAGSGSDPVRSAGRGGPPQGGGAHTDPKAALRRLGPLGLAIRHRL